MKATFRTGYGSADVLEFRDIDDTVVGENDVLVRVHAAGCGPDVWHLMTGLPYFVRLMPGFYRLRAGVRGRDVAGTVEAVGASVTGLGPGDEVMGIAEGSFAELAIARPDKLVPKPAGLTFEEAAALPISGLTALQAIRDVGKVHVGVASSGTEGFVGDTRSRTAGEPSEQDPLIRPAPFGRVDGENGAADTRGKARELRSCP
jgi:NADPH:quinone reductase-like Zn-dependent oxidoreductase